MDDTFTCPVCHRENAYFDGVVFVCPDCGHEWTTTASGELEKASSKLIAENLVFESLIKLKKPFFRLKRGKIYDCKVEHERGIENISIIPLAFEKAKNCQFVMIDARKLFTKNPRFFKKIIQMDFRSIMNDGTCSYYPSDYDPITILCTTKNDGTLLESDGSIYFDFKESNEI